MVEVGRSAIIKLKDLDQCVQRCSLLPSGIAATIKDSTKTRIVTAASVNQAREKIHCWRPLTSKGLPEQIEG